MSTRLTIWGTPALRRVAARRSSWQPFPIGRADCTLFSRARHALFAGVRQLGLREGDEVLTPAYHHGSEIEALRRAGLRCRFYDVTAGLEPNVSDLDARVGPRTRALLLVHYLGRPQPVARWRAWCDERNLLLLEDAAQSWLATSEGAPAGSSGDLAIFCLYKTLPLPDGAALVCDPPPAAPTEHALGAAAWARGASDRFPSVKKMVRGALRRRAAPPLAADFDLGDPNDAPTRLTARLLPRLLDADIARRRTANYEALAERLASFMAPPFDQLPARASPMLLPLSVERERKVRLLESLARHDIEGVDFWSVPHPDLVVAEFPVSARLRDSLVGVPVHQGLTDRDLERIIGAVTRA